jgi:hypothetical protein
VLAVVRVGLFAFFPHPHPIFNSFNKRKQPILYMGM